MDAKKFDYDADQPILVSLMPIKKLETVTKEQNQRIVELIDKLNQTAKEFDFRLQGYGNAKTYAELFVSDCQ